MSESVVLPRGEIESKVSGPANARKLDRKHHALLAIATSSFVLALSCALALLAGEAQAQAQAPLAQNAITRGLLTYYGKAFAGRTTASGEPFDPEALTMAHNTLPFGTRVRVTNLRNRKSVVVRVNDRGPHGPRRVGDVSLAAARLLGMVRAGVVEASFEVIDRAQ